MNAALSGKTSILLADDHAIVREGLKHLIEAEADMVVAAEAGSGHEALAKALAMCPHIAVLDVSLGDMNGAECTRRMRQECPQTRVLALTVHEDTSYVQALLEAGASGYVLKRGAADDLIRAIRVVAEGGVYVDPDVAGRLVRNLVRPKTSKPRETLSERETDVLRLLAQGYSNKEIAARLNVSVKTIETYKARGMEKLDLRSRVDIVRHAADNGWL